MFALNHLLVGPRNYRKCELIISILYNKEKGGVKLNKADFFQIYEISFFLSVCQYGWLS